MSIPVVECRGATSYTYFLSNFYAQLCDAEIVANECRGALGFSILKLFIFFVLSLIFVQQNKTFILSKY